MTQDATPVEFPGLHGAKFSAVRAFASPCCADEGDSEHWGHAFIWTTPISTEALDELERQWDNLWVYSAGDFYSQEDRRRAAALGVDVTLKGDELRDALRTARTKLLEDSGAVLSTLWINAAREFEYAYGCNCGVNHSPSYFDGQLRIVAHLENLYIVPADCDLEDTLRRAEKIGVEEGDAQTGRNAINFEKTLRYRSISSRVLKSDEKNLRIAFALAQGTGDYSALSEFYPFGSAQKSAEHARAQALERSGVAVLTEVDAPEFSKLLLPA
jgi:hypothetical protein